MGLLMQTTQPGSNSNTQPNTQHPAMLRVPAPGQSRGDGVHLGHTLNRVLLGAVVAVLVMLAHPLAHAGPPGSNSKANTNTNTNTKEAEANLHLLPRKFDFRQSFKSPMFLGVSNSTDIPYFEAGGPGVIKGDRGVRLASSLSAQSGFLSATHPNPHAEWQVVLQWNVVGQGYVGTHGSAFWYTKDRVSSGPFFGTRPVWQGRLWPCIG